MKIRCINKHQSSQFLPTLLILAITCTLFTSFSWANSPIPPSIDNEDIDVNDDGTINILVLGTNSSINGTEIFSPDQIVEELQNILLADADISLDINVVAEDIHMSQVVTLGLGGAGTEYNWTHHSHSLTQYLLARRTRGSYG